MDTMPAATRAFTTCERSAPYGCRVSFTGDWGFETNTRLTAVLADVPLISRHVNLDCRRITMIDGTTMTTMMRFVETCGGRGVGVTFECDDDPVERLISICHLDALAVERRPRKNTAGRIRR